MQGLQVASRPVQAQRQRHALLTPSSRPQCIARALSERELQVKISIAGHTDRLDLSDCQLTSLDPSLFELANLRELSLAGNQLTELPAAISRLTALEKLVVAGNQLQQLPEEIAALQQLEGLWAHGNLLQDVPEALKDLTGLKALSLAGNCLQEFPAPVLAPLTRLTDLNLSGNSLASLPASFSCLSKLRNLALHGNQLQQLPLEGWVELQQLTELGLQGNQLQQVPDGLGQLKAVTELSLADNQISQLPEDLSGLVSLQKLHLYGNQLQELPLGPRGLQALMMPGPEAAEAGAAAAAAGGSGERRAGGSLRALWLEGNPLSPDCVGSLLKAAAAATAAGRQLRLGLDQQQLAGADAAEGCAGVRPGVVLGSGPGYFKLQPASPAAVAAAAAAGCPRVLLVAFGSAPGLPNWGGVLSKVQATAAEEHHRCFDVLFVVDPHRSWYRGGDPQALQQYTDRLRQYTQQYEQVVMVGDSMGATASLLFSGLATSVLAFCPQVDLSTSSIRPGKPVEWHQELQKQLQAAVGSSPARVRVFTGTWQHDVAQAELLAHHPNVEIKAYGADTHRLALALAARGRLVGLLQDALLQAMGCLAQRPVRMANYL